MTQSAQAEVCIHVENEEFSEIAKENRRQRQRQQQRFSQFLGCLFFRG